MGLRRSKDALKSCISQVPNTIDLATVKWTWDLSDRSKWGNHTLFQKFGTGIEKHWPYFFKVSGTSDYVTSGAVGQYVQEAAERRPFTCRRVKVCRKDTVHAVPR